MDLWRGPTRAIARVSHHVRLTASVLLLAVLAFAPHTFAQEPPDPFVAPTTGALDARYEQLLRELAATPAGRAFLDALLLIDREYLYTVDRDVLLRGATAGLIAALDDPFSRYLAPEEVAARRERPTGEADVIKATLGDIGYIGVTSFDGDGIGAAVGRAIDAHLAGGARGLLLDLRGNTGGSILQGLQVLDRFLADGVLGFRRVRGVSVPIAYANPRAVAQPLVVVVDEVTGSTAEIVAGALQAYGRAQIVGSVTAGKGIGQTAIELSDGAEIQLVSFEWLLPGFRSIDGSGLRPDLEVTERRVADVPNGTSVRGMQDVANDPVLRAAVQLLRDAIGDELSAPGPVPVPTPGAGPTVLPFEPDAGVAEPDEAPADQADEPDGAMDGEPDGEVDDETPDDEDERPADDAANRHG